MEVEIWKDIPDYEGLYQVSDLGRVRSSDRMVANQFKSYLKKGRLLKPFSSGNGYLQVVLAKDSVNIKFNVHVLVAICFHGHIPNGKKIHIDHINDNKKDNRASNLKIVTARRNTTKTKKEGTSSKYIGVHWWNSKQRWIAQIRINGRNKYIGSFKDEYEAHLAYQHELKKLQAKEKAPI